MTRVVKLGGRVQDDAALAPAIAEMWESEPGALCVVHGGGDEISRLQRASGDAPRFVGGRRVTTERDIDLVRMALSGAANKRLVSRLVAAGVPAIGLSGEDAALMVATRADSRPAGSGPPSGESLGGESLSDGSLGCVGVPTRFNVSLLSYLLVGGYLPVISPVARAAAGECGGALNVNGDDAAAALAVAVGASELLFVSDVPGVMVEGAPVAALDEGLALELVAKGAAADGMAAKLQAAIVALDGGVAQVRIGGLAALTDAKSGSAITLARSAV